MDDDTLSPLTLEASSECRKGSAGHIGASTVLSSLKRISSTPARENEGDFEVNAAPETPPLTAGGTFCSSSVTWSSRRGDASPIPLRSTTSSPRARETSPEQEAVLGSPEYDSLDGPPSPWQESYPRALPIDPGIAKFTLKSMFWANLQCQATEDAEISPMDEPEDQESSNNRKDRTTKENTVNSDINHASYRLPTRGSARKNGTKRGFDDEDEDEDDESEKPRQPNSSLLRLSMPLPKKFACPYQKFDPAGSSLCCSPKNTNELGGCMSVHRVKYAGLYLAPHVDLCPLPNTWF